MGRERQRRKNMATATKTDRKARGDLSTLSKRDQEIVTDLINGEPRVVVAQRHDLTPERVRQISAPFLSDITESREDLRKRRRERNHQVRLERVKKVAEDDPSMRPAVIASTVGGGITTQDVIDVIGEKDALRRDQIRFVEDPVFTRKFTDEECFEALRAASKRVGKKEGKKDGEYGVLTMVLYAENSDPEDPKRSTIQRRFGTWQNACKKAGVPSGGPIPRRVYKEKWTDEDIVAVMRQFFSEVGVFGSMRQYADWARNVPGTPTQATVRARFGSWTEVKKIAAEMAESNSK